MEGEEESGFTILEFTRKYITCDKNDLPITVSDDSLCVCVMVLKLTLGAQVQRGLR